MDQFRTALLENEHSGQAVNQPERDTRQIIVDTAERVRAFLPELDELVTEGLVILDDCEVIRYVGREEPR